MAKSGWGAAEMQAIRRQFPALARTVGGSSVAFLDGPAGTQVPQRVIHSIGRYLSECNANHGGVFATAVESDLRLEEAHRAFADFVGAEDGDEIAFGQNMTSLTFAISRALSRTWGPGDEVLVTRLDHDANVTPWVRAAEDVGAVARHVDIARESCTLDMEDFYRKLNPRTRLVAVGGASNAVGTINPLREVVRASVQVGARVFVDAVHLAPHQRLDVRRWGCDFLACSPYKFFGPHLGVLWGKRELLEALPAYKVRPAPNELPGKWMTGTQSHESICGAMAAVDYLADLGRGLLQDEGAGRGRALDRAFEEIARHERGLAERFLKGFRELKGWKLWGIADLDRIDERVATFSITHDRLRPHEIAERLARRGIFVWHGNYYALSLSEWLGQEPWGMVRLGFVHYNTTDEVDRTLSELADIG